MERFTVAPEDQNEEPTSETRDEPENKYKKTKRKRQLRKKGGRVGLTAANVEKTDIKDEKPDKTAERAAEKDYFAKLLADVGIKKELTTESGEENTRTRPHDQAAANIESEMAEESDGSKQTSEHTAGQETADDETPQAEKLYRLDETEKAELYNRKLHEDELHGGEVIIDSVDRTIAAGEQDPYTEAAAGAEADTHGESAQHNDPQEISHETPEDTAEPPPSSPSAVFERTGRTQNEESENDSGRSPHTAPTSRRTASIGTVITQHFNAAESSPRAETAFDPPLNRANTQPLVPPIPPSAPRFNLSSPPPLNPNAAATSAPLPTVLRSPFQNERVVIKRSARDFWAGAAVGALIEHGRHKRKEKKLTRRMESVQHAQAAELERTSFENQLLQRKEQGSAREVAAMRASINQLERADFAAQTPPERAAAQPKHVEKTGANYAPIPRAEKLPRPAFSPSPEERTKAVFRTDITEVSRGGLPGIKSEKQKAAEKMAESVRTKVIAEATNKEDQMNQLKLPKGHRIERSAWHNIEVDAHTGRAVENSSIEYGEEYYKERAHERSGSDDFVGAAATGVALAAMAATRARTHTAEDAKSEMLTNTNAQEQDDTRTNKRKSSERDGNDDTSAKNAGGKATAAAAQIASAGKDAGKYIASAATEAAKKTIDTVSRPPTTNAGMAGWTIALLALLLGLLMLAL